MIRRFLSVGGVALGVSLMTPLAMAEEPTAPATAPTPEPTAEQAPTRAPAAAPAASGAALALRPQKPLELAPKREESSSSVWKLFALAVVLGGGFYVWKTKKGQKSGAPGTSGAKPTIEIITRKSIGIRSELVVVEVKGALMLLGVTPQSIQMVTTFGDDAAPVSFSEPSPAPVIDINASRPVAKISEVPLERQVLGLVKKTKRAQVRG